MNCRCSKLDQKYLKKCKTLEHTCICSRSNECYGDEYIKKCRASQHECNCSICYYGYIQKCRALEHNCRCQIYCSRCDFNNKYSYGNECRALEHKCRCYNFCKTCTVNFAEVDDCRSVYHQR